MKYTVSNFTGDEIHKLWNEIQEEERKELFDDLVEYADTEEINLEVGETEHISDSIVVEKLESGFKFRTGHPDDWTNS